MGRGLHDLGFNTDFWAVTTKTQAKKEKNKLDFIKMNCAAKDTIYRVEGQLTEKEKIRVNHNLIRSQYPMYINNSYKTTKTKQSY